MRFSSVSPSEARQGARALAPSGRRGFPPDDLLVEENARGILVYYSFEPRQEIRGGVVNIAGRDFHRCGVGSDDDRPSSGVRCAALNGEAFSSARYAGRLLAHHLTWCAPALRFLVVRPAPGAHVPRHRPVDFRRSVLVSHPTQSGADLSYFGDVITVPRIRASMSGSGNGASSTIQPFSPSSLTANKVKRNHRSSRSVIVTTSPRPGSS
jgi:hypothetical protein